MLQAIKVMGLWRITLLWVVVTYVSSNSASMHWISVSGLRGKGFHMAEAYSWRWRRGTRCCEFRKVFRCQWTDCGMHFTKMWGFQWGLLGCGEVPQALQASAESISNPRQIFKGIRRASAKGGP